MVPFEPTPLDDIPHIAKQLQVSHVSGIARSLKYRISQLRRLYWAINDNEKAICEACSLDLGRSYHETSLIEVDWLKNDIVFTTQNLEKWMDDESPPDIPLTDLPLRPKIRKEPLGAVLIIGAYNVPFQLSIGPFVGAIAAGCTAVIKPSEVASHSAMVMKRLIEESLDPQCYTVINGGVPETSALLNEKWDKIFYTGGAAVGTIIAKKAAETLTPVCLELGGRNPAFVTKNANARLAARRLLWGKSLNAGQVCLSHNYTLVEKAILPSFVQEMENGIKEFWPGGAKESADYGRIINRRHFARIKKMLDDSEGRIVIGGEVDEAESFIEPTMVLVPDKDDSMIRDESFGPLMPVIVVNSVDEALDIARLVDPTPLGLYPFGSDAEISKILNSLTSGGASINDAYYHGSIPTLAFGGVGSSGIGAYRGRASFDVFTHRRSITRTPGWLEALLNVRYPPYQGKLAEIRRMQTRNADFNRDGKTIKGLRFFISAFLRLMNRRPWITWITKALLLAVGVRAYSKRL